MALQQSATPLTSHHPLVEQVFNHPTLVTQETISQQPVSIPSRENLRNQLQYVILQEEIKQATLAQQAQLNEAQGAPRSCPWRIFIF
jgi:hypothetical protein